MSSAIKAASPRIESFAWGAMTVEGCGQGKDYKLYPGGGRSWDWNETGTRHMPGIQPADVQELLEHGAEVIVLSRGMRLRLQTSPETLALLRNRNVEVLIEESQQAAQTYNRLVDAGRAVGGLFHSTC